MDEKQTALEDFLKNLRIAYNYILLYSSGHRAFRTAISRLKQKVDAALVFLDPLVVGFSPTGLILDGQKYEKMSVHQELARLIHLRKIKSIEFRRGITEDELSSLLSKIALSAQEIAAAGGAGALFSPEETAHCTVEDLDYSVLLKKEGREVENPWAFLLGHDALGQADDAKIDALIENFEATAAKIKISMLRDDPRLRESVVRFLEFVRQRQPQRFVSCARSLLRSLLRDRSLQQDSQLDDFKDLLQGLSQEDLATVLFEEVSGEESFDAHTFDLFSRLVEQTMHPRIASAFAQQVNDAPVGAVGLRINKRLRELFSFAKESEIPAIYRNALLALDQGSMFEQEIRFDRAALEKSYCYILLELLLVCDTREDVALIVGRLLERWPGLAAEKDFEYLRCLWESVQKKKSATQAVEPIAELDAKIGAYIERLLWEPAPVPELAYFIDRLKQSFLQPEEYLQMIFGQARYSARMLTMYFQFFPNRLQDFYAALAGRSSDIEFLMKLIESLADLQAHIASPILEHIFSCANDIIKAEVLKAMDRLSQADTGFLCMVLSKESSFLKREALAVLKKHEETQAQAVGILLGIENPWGKKNQLLLENLALIEELEIRQARRALEILARKRFFWHRSVRAKARSILERWNA